MCDIGMLQKCVVGKSDSLNASSAHLEFGSSNDEQSLYFPGDVWLEIKSGRTIPSPGDRKGEE